MKKNELVVLIVVTILLWAVIGIKLYFGEIKVSLSSQDPIYTEMKKVVKNTAETRTEIKKVKTGISEVKEEIAKMKKKVGVRKVVSTPSTKTSVTPEITSKEYRISAPSGYQDTSIKRVVIKGKNSEGEKFKKELLKGEKALISLKEGLSVIKYTMYLTDNEKINGKIEISLTAKGNVTFIIGGGR